MKTIISLFISSIFLFSCGEKSSKTSKALSSLQQDQIEEINQQENPPTEEEVKTFQQFFNEDLKLNQESQVIFNKQVVKGEQILLRLTNFLQEDPIIKEQREELDYCYTQDTQLSKIACTSLDLLRQINGPSLRAIIDLRTDVQKFTRIKSILEQWSQEKFVLPLFPDDLFFKIYLNGEEINLTSSDELEDEMHWFVTADQDGVLEVRFEAPIFQDNFINGHTSPKLYPCEFFLRRTDILDAYVTDKNLIDGQGYCNVGSFLSFSSSVTQESKPLFSRINGSIEALFKEP